MYGFKPRYLNYRHAAACMALALATVALAAGAPVAQAQTVTVNNCANPILDAAGQPFGCLLSELIDANGGSIEVEPAITPAVKIEFVFDQNSFRPNATGATDTDPANIGVIPVALRTNRPGLQFIDNNNEWKVQGGPAPNFQSNNKRDVIEYVVVARDPQTNQPVARIKDAEVALQPGAVTSNDPNAPGRAAVRDIVSDFDIVTNTKLGSLTPGGMEVFKSTDAGEDLEETRTFDPPQDAVHFLKEVKVEPGSDPASMAEIENIRQHVSLTADKEVGCAPGAINPAGGGQTTVELCPLPSGNQIPIGADPISQSQAIGFGFGFGFGTFNPTTGNDKVWHSIKRADTAATLVDHIRNLDSTLPPSVPANTIDLSEFDVGTKLLTLVKNERLPNSVLHAQSVDVVELIRGESATIFRAGEIKIIRGANRQIDRLFGVQSTNNPKAFVDVDLLIPGTFIRIAAILVYDIADVFSGGGAPLIHTVLPGDTVQTAQGPLALLSNLVETAAVNKNTNAILIRDTGTGFPADRNLVLVEDFGTGQARRVASTGDPVGGGLKVIDILLTGSVNGGGDAAYLTRIGPPGAIFSTDNAAHVSPAAGGSLPILMTGDAVPGISGAQVRSILAVGINDSRRGAISFNYLDGNIFKSGLLGFGFDDTAVTLEPSTLLAGGDTVTDSAGNARGVAFFQMDPRGVGADSVGLSSLFDDGTNAVVIIPLSAMVATVPDVTDFDQASAEALIVANGFGVGTVTTQSSDTVPAGDVISQSPAPGTLAAPGSAVDLVVSSGPALAVVPDVFGLVQLDAEAAIVAAGLTLGTVSTQNSNTDPVGETVAQNPAAGAQVPFGSTVDLTVSLGPAPVMGDVDGDGDVDRDDINLILAARNQPASGPDDPHDLDGDGVITVLDARKAVLLCTRPRCAT